MFRLCLILVLPIFAQAGEWQHYGGDAGGQRYVSLEQITPNNVSELEIAWQFNTGDKGTKPLDEMALEVTPILVEDSLVFCTPFNRIIAIDPGTGKQKWQYDVNLSLDIDPANQFVCRGVTYWQDAMATPETKCSSRIFMATNDTRLVSVDAKTGEACAGFSDHEDNTSRPGEINVGAKVELYWPGEYQMTSPPVVLNDVVIIGSAISDNARVEAPAGVVKAFDARTGTRCRETQRTQRIRIGNPATTLKPVLQMSGHPCRLMRDVIWCFCLRRAQVLIFTLPPVPVTINMPIQLWH